MVEYLDEGMIAFASSLDQAGPISKSAEDAAILMNVIAGADNLDSTSSGTPVADYTLNLNDSLHGLKSVFQSSILLKGYPQTLRKISGCRLSNLKS